MNCGDEKVKIDDLQDMPDLNELAVIINCGTLAPATLALFSAMRHLDMPVLLIDCESPDGSLEHFQHLQAEQDFFLLSAPLNGHGVTLDWIFRSVRAKKVVLVDSDVEILSGEISIFMRQFIDAPLIFGAGFIQGPTSIDDKPGTFLEDALFAERPWIPLVMFRVDRIREALSAGHSFAAKTVYNASFGLSLFAKRLVAWRVRAALPRIFRIPKILRSSYAGHQPEVIYFDTGSKIFHHLRYECELFMVALPERMHLKYCTHFDGLTRAALGEVGDRRRQASELARFISKRLLDVYRVELTSGKPDCTSNR